MIIDKTWNKKEQKLIISYTNKQGRREFYQRYLHHIATYEYDKDGKFDTWNGKKCNKIFKDTTQYTPNEFDFLEFMYNLPEDLLTTLRSQNFPKLYTFDIETEYSNEFPYPDKALHKVTAISLVGPDLSCIVYGLNEMSEDSKSLFRDRYLEWISNNKFAKSLVDHNGWEPKCLYQYFSSEEKMLEHFFTVIIPKIPVLAGWNAYNFDYQYLYNRIVRLFGQKVARNMIYKASPTNEIGRISFLNQNNEKIVIPSPRHSLIVDYMEIVKAYDYVLRPYESYSLDWVSSHAINAHKIQYNGDLQTLYLKDHEWYYYYNAVDSLLVQLIHYKLKSIESPCAAGAITLVPLLDAFGQVALTNANVFNEFYNQGKKVVYQFDEIARVKEEYKGAFCGCVPGRYEYNVCDDFASLYPSQIQTCNLSFENILPKPQIGPDSLGRYIERQWTEEELDKFRKDPNYFVTVNNNVYKNDKDYTFKIVQRNIKKQRDKYKYTGQRIESELLVEIDRLIKEKESA